MRVFLTGATGYIGTAVAEKLKAAGHTVLGLARNDAAAQKLEAQGHTAFRGDFTDPGYLAQATREADAVISTGTTNDAQQDISAIEMMIEAVSGTNKPFIYTSGCWVLGDTGGQEVGDDAPVNPLPLVAWRPAVEQRVLRANGVRSIVIRPGVVYGNGAGIPASFAGAAAKGDAVRMVGTGDAYWPLVHVDDLADLYVLLLEKAPAKTVLNAVSESVPVRDVANAAVRGAGHGTVEVWPLEQARQALGPFADALATSQRMSSAAARKLGWQPKAPSIIAEMERGSYTQ